MGAGAARVARSLGEVPFNWFYALRIYFDNLVSQFSCVHLL